MRATPTRFDLLVLRFRALVLSDNCACHNLGAILATGAHGEATNIQNEASAVRWYARAACRGHLESQYDLGWMLLLGEGVAKDQREALHWIGVAAHAGHPESIRLLADVYSSGRFGVAANEELAQFWSRELSS